MKTSTLVCARTPTSAGFSLLDGGTHTWPVPDEFCAKTVHTTMVAIAIPRQDSTAARRKPRILDALFSVR
jgi:hypothetical protein